MNYKKVTAFAPASVANVGCGFDFMGFAIEGAGDRVTIETDETNSGIKVILSGPYGDLLPSAADKNTAGVAARAFLLALGKGDASITISLEKNLPLGSGMGSSASSAAAALCSVNAIFGNPLSSEELIPFAMEGERVACGTAHADNVAPSLLGGFLIIRSYDPLDIIKIHCPDDLYCAVVHPHIQLKTSDARRILRRDLPLTDVTKQSANVAAFITGILRNDYDLIGRSMHDLVAEPKRTQLIPGFVQAKIAALGSGAVGCGISGSGPSVFALCRGKDAAIAVAGEMARSFSVSGLGSDTFISTMNAPGAYIV
jgi:homoserine kinase